MDDDDDDTAGAALAAFQRRVWALERLAARQGGFLKLAPAQPTAIKAYAARMYRAVSRMSFVDLPDAVPMAGEVCAFNAQQWARMPLWDVHQTLVACRGRLVLVAVVGTSSRQESEQTMVFAPVEIGRVTAI